MNQTPPADALFGLLDDICARPLPFECYSARELWTDDHTSRRMLDHHLDGTVDMASRRTEFLDRSAAWIVEHFHLGPGVRVAEFGCGPGLYTNRLARSGADITGLDFSWRSIQHARDVAARENLAVRYLIQDYLAYETEERYDLVGIIMCDFCVLGPEQRAGLLRRIRGLLVPGGALLLDAYSLAAFAAREETATFAEGLLDHFWAPGRYYGFLNVFKYEPEMVVLDKYTILERERIRRVYNWLQYFSPDSLRAEIEEAGLELAETLGDVAGAPHDPEGAEFAVVARRP